MVSQKRNLTISIKGTLPQLLKRVPFLAIKEKVLGKGYDLSLAFVSPAVAKALNTMHRGKDYVPDTLAFPLTKKSGEIAMCRSAMRKKLKIFGMDDATFTTFLFIHSCLHLKGYAHGATMEHKEKQLLKLFVK